MIARRLFLLAISMFLLAACQPRPAQVTIFADGEIVTFTSSQRLPARLLEEAGLSIGDADRLLYLGVPIPVDRTLPGSGTITLIVRRAVRITLISPDGESESLLSSAASVGEVLMETNLSLHKNDFLDPPAGTPITGDMDIIWQPASALTITVDGTQVNARSTASTVGEALAEMGFPLMGLDYSIPADTEPLPRDGNIRLVRVTEVIALTLKSIPHGTRTEFSADLEIDQQEFIQGGESGLAAARLRTRLEDGNQVSQVAESESIIRPPQDQVLGIGTKIVIRTAVVDGVEIEYWRALTLYATYYVPCGAGQPRCYYGTSSGTLVRKGAVAMVYPWYLLFAGERLYIPGYGFGIVEDNNGANTNALGDTYWIDLGYSMTDVVDWTTRYVTVYFLTPVPANVADTYILP